MDRQILGIHHVTAICSDAQANVDFYAGVLGLRLVKVTVNFDDPTSHHLYYGDELGRPGSVMTFFAWPGAFRGRIGTGQVTVTSFSAPASSVDFWEDRLRAAGYAVQRDRRWDEQVLVVDDPDGLHLEIVGSERDPRPAWAKGPVPATHALRGFHTATLSEEGYERTAELLTTTMGFRKTAEQGNRFRYETSAGGPGATVDLLCQPDARHGTMGVGAVHHIAWRTPDEAQQVAWRDEIARLRFNVSPVMDRTYFHSIYFREPGGVLFEIATDVPGFTADEPAESLGTTLRLPPWLEKARPQLEELLPKLRLPGGA